MENLNPPPGQKCFVCGERPATFPIERAVVVGRGAVAPGDEAYGTTEVWVCDVCSGATDMAPAGRT